MWIPGERRSPQRRRIAAREPAVVAMRSALHQPSGSHTGPGTFPGADELNDRPRRHAHPAHTPQPAVIPCYLSPNALVS